MAETLVTLASDIPTSGSDREDSFQVLRRQWDLVDMDDLEYSLDNTTQNGFLDPTRTFSPDFAGGQPTNWTAGSTQRDARDPTLQTDVDDRVAWWVHREAGVSPTQSPVPLQAWEGEGAAPHSGENGSWGRRIAKQGDSRLRRASSLCDDRRPPSDSRTSSTHSRRVLRRGQAGRGDRGEDTEDDLGSLTSGSTVGQHGGLVEFGRGKRRNGSTGEHSRRNLSRSQSQRVMGSSSQSSWWHPEDEVEAGANSLDLQAFRCDQSPNRFLFQGAAVSDKDNDRAPGPSNGVKSSSAVTPNGLTTGLFSLQMGQEVQHALGAEQAHLNLRKSADGALVPSGCRDTTGLQPHQQRPPSKRIEIYLCDQKFTWTLAQLREHCMKFGAVENAKVVSDEESETGKGFGLATFGTEEAAKRCVLALDQSVVEGVRLIACFAEEDDAISTMAASPPAKTTQATHSSVGKRRQHSGGRNSGSTGTPSRRAAKHPPVPPLSVQSVSSASNGADAVPATMVQRAASQGVAPAPRVVHGQVRHSQSAEPLHRRGVTPVAAPPTNSRGQSPTAPKAVGSAGSTKAPVGPAEARRNNVYICDYPHSWNTTRLRELCAPYGTIRTAKAMMNEATNEGRGFGFVMFETDEEAASCIAGLQGMIVEGNTLSARIAHDKAAPQFGLCSPSSHSGAKNPSVNSSLHLGGASTPHAHSSMASRYLSNSNSQVMASMTVYSSYPSSVGGAFGQDPSLAPQSMAPGHYFPAATNQQLVHSAGVISVQAGPNSGMSTVAYATDAHSVSAIPPGYVITGGMSIHDQGLGISPAAPPNWFPVQGPACVPPQPQPQQSLSQLGSLCYVPPASLQGCVPGSAHQQPAGPPAMPVAPLGGRRTSQSIPLPLRPADDAHVRLNGMMSHMGSSHTAVVNSVSPMTVIDMGTTGIPHNFFSPAPLVSERPPVPQSEYLLVSGQASTQERAPQGQPSLVVSAPVIHSGNRPDSGVYYVQSSQGPPPQAFLAHAALIRHGSRVEPPDDVSMDPTSVQRQLRRQEGEQNGRKQGLGYHGFTSTVPGKNGFGNAYVEVGAVPQQQPYYQQQRSANPLQRLESLDSNMSTMAITDNCHINTRQLEMDMVPFLRDSATQKGARYPNGSKPAGEAHGVGPVVAHSLSQAVLSGSASPSTNVKSHPNGSPSATISSSPGSLNHDSVGLCSPNHVARSVAPSSIATGASESNRYPTQLPNSWSSPLAKPFPVSRQMGAGARDPTK